MNPTVHIETTIPSYYCSDRVDLRADIDRTREWWGRERQDYECFVSLVVLEELQAGVYPTQDECLALVQDLPILAVTPEIVDVAEVYQVRKLMPRFPVRDALHLAIASYYRMDYLLTWNCRHIANANKIPHLEIVNGSMGLPVPVLATPYMLQPWEDDDAI